LHNFGEEPVHKGQAPLFCRPVFPALKVTLADARASFSAHPTGLENSFESSSLNVKEEFGGGSISGLPVILK
jgi:hypothetical protein